jgi:hypothetical protein
LDAEKRKLLLKRTNQRFWFACTLFFLNMLLVLVLAELDSRAVGVSLLTAGVWLISMLFSKLLEDTLLK